MWQFIHDCQCTIFVGGYLFIVLHSSCTISLQLTVFKILKPCNWLTCELCIFAMSYCSWSFLTKNVAIARVRIQSVVATSIYICITGLYEQKKTIDSFVVCLLFSVSKNSTLFCSTHYGWVLFLSHRIFSVGVAKISLIFRRIPHRGGDWGFGGEP